MKTAERKIEWMTETAGIAKATITATAGAKMEDDVISADGWNVPIEKLVVTNDYSISLEVAGQKFSGALNHVAKVQPYKNKGILGIISKVAISDQTTMNLLDTAIAEAQAEAREDESFKNWKIKDDERKAGLRMYEESTARMEKIMSGSY